MTPNQQKYLRHYNLLITRAKRRGLDKSKIDFYVEQHHIIPKCMGGTNNKSNLVLLSGAEHYVAHQLLVKIYPLERLLVFGLKMMCSSNKFQNGRITNKLYEWCKIKINKAMIGQTKENNLSKKAGAEKLSGRNKENDEGYAKISASLTGRNKENDESKRNASKKLSGRNKENDEGYAKISASQKGRTSKTHDYIAKHSENRRILSLSLQDLVVNMRNDKTLKEIQSYLFEKHDISISISAISKTYYYRISNS